MQESMRGGTWKNYDQGDVVLSPDRKRVVGVRDVGGFKKYTYGQTLFSYLC